MKFLDYIRDKKFFLAFYIILMTFVSLVVLLDSEKSIHLSNLIYINLVAFFMMILYLITGYLYYKRYYKALEKIIKDIDYDVVYNLPEPLSRQQGLYNQVLNKLYREQKEIIEKQNLEKRENKDFVSSWFHQIKTPIAVSRLIVEEKDNYSKEEIIRNISEEIDKIESQVEQALYYSKIDVFEKDYFIQEVNLDEIVSGVIRKHARSFISKKIVLDKQDLNIMVNTDKKWLSFIIDQILSNSLKYTEIRDKISIRGEAHKNRKVLYIRDSGMGIKEEDLSRVFDKGFTGYIGRREEKSTGIGLYLASKLVTRLGHEINISSQYGEYTEVKLVFPKLSNIYDLE
ncbi:MAG: sensor histidine kinase [Halanaerobiales bacterium]